MKINSFSVLGLALSVFVAAATAFAVNRTYVGDASGSWDNAANWDPPGVPNYQDNVTIPEGSEVQAGGINFVNNITNHGTITGYDLSLNANYLSNYGEITGASSIEAKNGLTNVYGASIAGPDYLYISSREGSIFNGGTIDACVNISCPKGIFTNTGTVELLVGLNAKHVENGTEGLLHVNPIGEATIAAEESLVNEGSIEVQPYEISNPAGDNLNIFCMNQAGTAILKNSGSIIGSDSSSSDDGADNIYINADIVENTGIIQTGANGSGLGVYGGYGFFKAKEFTSCIGSQLITGYGGSVLYFGKKVDFVPGMLRSPMDDEPIINSEYVMIAGAELRFSYLPVNTIIGEYGIEIENINSPGYYANFISLEDTSVFRCLYGDIYIRSDNVFAPPIGMNAICSPDPIISATMPTYSDMSIFAPFEITNQSVSDSVKYLIRNEHAYARSFNYTISSLLGWVTPITATTSILDPWESEPVWVHYTIPDSLDTTTTDIVTVSAVISTWSDTVLTTLVAFPFDTLLTPLAVEENSTTLPEALTISAHPNPFNSAVTIAIDGVGDGSPVPFDVEIYDVAGRMVADAEPADKPHAVEAGAGRLAKDTSTGSVSVFAPLNKGGQGGSYIWRPDASVTSGVYLVRALIGDESISKRVVYLK